jgi:hypothetical protein
MSDKIKEAYDEFLLSDKFKEEREKYLKAPRYEYYKNTVSNDDFVLPKLLEDNKIVLERFKDPSTVLGNHDLLNNYIRERKNDTFDLYISSLIYTDKFENTDFEKVDDISKTITDLLNNYHNELLDSHKDEFAKESSKESLNLIKLLSVNTINELKSLLETTAICNQKEIEEIVTNHFDFSNLIFLKEGDSIFYEYYNGYPCDISSMKKCSC